MNNSFSQKHKPIEIRLNREEKILEVDFDEIKDKVLESESLIETAQELLFDTVDYSWSNYSQYSDRYYNWKNHDYVVELYGNDAADEGFGSVISMYGNILVVGTETGNKAYVYKRTSRNAKWSVTPIITLQPPSDLIGSDTGFATAIDIFNDTIIVGAYSAKCAFIYEPLQHEWIDNSSDNMRTTRICRANSGFGYSVSIFENTAVVGTEDKKKVYLLNNLLHNGYYCFQKKINFELF